MSGPQGIPVDSKYLEFPPGRTDGDSSRWPDKLDPTPNADKEVNYMRPVTRDEPLGMKWRTSVGSGVAKLMGLPNHKKYILKDYPEGYKFFQNNKGFVHDPRTDPYLYGSKSGRFRSSPEFIPHAYWLMTDEKLDRKNCRCKYCASTKSQKQISQDLGLTPKQSGPSTGNSFSAPHVKPKMRPVAQPRKPQSRTVVSHDRTGDLRSTRRFRVGELVWCALSPPIEGTNPDECIEFWPGLVSETRLKTEATSHAPAEKWRVIQSNVYKVKLLAVMHSFVLPENAVLPYQAYCPSVNLIEPLRRAGDPGLLRDLETLSAFNPVFLGAEISGQPQLRFVQASTPFALAIQIAAHLVRLWTPSDDWTFHGETPVTPSSTQPPNAPALAKVTESRYQGLWWGAERVWVEELVRLQPGRAQVVPQGSSVIYRASPRADGRGVLMRINSIFSEAQGPQRDALRECKVAGVLYELAEATYEETPEDSMLLEPDAEGSSGSSMPTTNNNTVAPADTLLPPGPSQQLPAPPPASSPINIPSFPPYPLPEPPSGYKFRQITKPGYEIILDVSLVAGRYYPGLLRHPLLQDALADVDMNESRVTQLGALCGLLPGAINAMECMDWVRTRLAMVRLADVKAQQDLHQHWHTSTPVDEQVKAEDAMDTSPDNTEPKDAYMEHASG